MSEIWINLLVSLIALVATLVLHAFLVMCEVSLVKLRYDGRGVKGLERLQKLRGIARLIENSDKTGRTVRHIFFIVNSVIEDYRDDCLEQEGIGARAGT